jgi:exopolyphosphatase/guanosine-5'-triphosphate,3'-diphosphate pyrophosphatase
MSKKSSAKRISSESGIPAGPIAVIDIGSSSMRMVIAQIRPDGSVQTLESLQQEVSLGRDTFTKGYIQKESIEACVDALRSFRQTLDQYGITDRAAIRAVATSAVREATNRDAFLDRVYIATGLDVTPIDVAEINRFTYLSLRPLLVSHPQVKTGKTIVIEVGGGSTEVLAVQRGRVAASHSYRLGAFRMREMYEGRGAAVTHVFEAIENQIQQTVKRIRDETAGRGRINLVILGGDARFAASQLLPEWNKNHLSRIPLSSLSHFTSKILAYSIDELVHRYHLSYPGAETLGPALLTYVDLARELDVRSVLVTGITMREGVVAEMATGNPWTSEFRDQAIRSAIDLGKKYDFSRDHAEYVARIARTLFEALQPEHTLAPRFELLLTIAALLHEIGLYVSNRSHHKHSMYLIQNSELFGLGSHDIQLVALTARYHRRAFPKPAHYGYGDLSREDRVAVAKMASILRLADAFDTSHTQRISDIETDVQERRIILTAIGAADLTLEQISMREKGAMFEHIYGKQVILRQSTAVNQGL